MNRQQINELVTMPLQEVMLMANEARKEGVGNKIEVCGVINAKSGLCNEDCKFCAQSTHYDTEVRRYSLKDTAEIIEAAEKASKNGAGRVGIVASGNRLNKEELDSVCEAIDYIHNNLDIEPCVSLGALDESSFRKLIDAGLERYHHNLETSERFYPEVVSTHDYSERVNTVKTAKKLGLEMCCGGILGLGETWDDRIDLALLLKELEVESIPLNFLVPIKGTPMEGKKSIDPYDAIRAISIFRIILKDKIIKVVAGRETILKDFQGLLFTAGANSMMVGGYLTIAGRAVEEDHKLLAEVKRLWDME